MVPLPSPARRAVRPDQALGTVAVLGMGYVGLPTSLALAGAGFDVIGVDVSERRLRDDPLGRRRHAAARPDAARHGSPRSGACGSRPSAAALGERRRGVHLRPDAGRRGPAPGPALAARRVRDRGRARTRAGPADRADQHHATSARRASCSIEPLLGPRAARRRGRLRRLLAGADRPRQRDQPPGGRAARRRRRDARTAPTARPTCVGPHRRPTRTASPRRRRRSSASSTRTPSAPSTSRSRTRWRTRAARSGLDPVEVIEAAATKPYGFMAFYPGAGVGGHCIPCDPHYLLENAARGAARTRRSLERAMQAIAARPRKVVERAPLSCSPERARRRAARACWWWAPPTSRASRTRASRPRSRSSAALRARRRARSPIHDPLVRTLEVGGGRAAAVGRAAEPGGLRPRGRGRRFTRATTTSWLRATASTCSTAPTGPPGGLRRQRHLDGDLRGTRAPRPERSPTSAFNFVAAGDLRRLPRW